ncbi:MAG TPA: SRPBCC family protein [Devosia sp.]|jgi:uncharacterized membrane protein|nr:SRPBCC family protein [Devosia sp.]
MATDMQADDAPTRARKRDKQDDLAVVGKAILIDKPRSELFAFWRDFSNLPQFMDNLERIEPLDGDRSRWVIKAPLGRTVAIETRVTETVPDSAIGWESTEGSDIKTRGRVTFADAPAGRGTVVTLEIAYDPPGGDVGRLVAKLFAREPNIQARLELKRFKMLMEAGEIAKGPDQLKKDE